MENDKEYIVKSIKNDETGIIELENALRRYEESCARVRERVREININYKDEVYRDAKREYKTANKSLFKRFISSTLSLAVVSTILFGGCRYISNKEKTNEYIKYDVSYYYNNKRYSNGTISESCAKEEYEGDKTYLTIYSEVGENKSRNISVYDVTDINFKTVEDAFKYDYSTLEPISSEICSAGANDYDSEYKNFKIIKANKTVSRNNASLYIIILLSILELFTELLLPFPKGYIKSIYLLVKNIKEREYCKEEYVSAVNELKPLVDSALFEIKLNKKYYELYH